MKEILAILIGSFLTCTNLHAKTIDRTIPIKDFNACTLRIPGKLYLSMGNNQALRIKGDSKAVNAIDVDVSNQELLLSTKKTKIHNIHDVEYHLTAKDLKRIFIYGQGHVIGQTPIKTYELLMRVSGNATANLELELSHLTLDLLGHGQVQFIGKAKYQDLMLTGNGHYEGFKLQSDEAYVNVSGNGSVNLNVKDILKIKVRGNAKVRYKGTPTISKDVSGKLDIQGE
ncbi:MAG: hypothetical protein SP1CHLAM54_11430 [Chlamydiia bacterium]|nr:hypothetical protein [Chlamydiia bacterium]MCH9616046.1 hypothetical protein [Chlamydiia bacterium]MCH9629069.1 hypothetical protein [Chlamydiia bacterium]